MTEVVVVIVSFLAFGVSAYTAWRTLWQSGTIKMTKPTIIYFGPDGKNGSPKIYFRALLYCTAKSGRIIENMYIKLIRGETTQNFNVWIYGDDFLARGSGLFIGENGVICNHHFILPKDGTQFEFFSGDYTIEVYAKIVGERRPLVMIKEDLRLSELHSLSMSKDKVGVFFDWGPDSEKYHAHVDERPIPPVNTISIG